MKAAKGIVVSINESDITLLGNDGVFYSVPLPEHVPLLGEELSITEAQLIGKPAFTRFNQWFTTKRVRSWGIVATLFLLLLSSIIFFPYSVEASYVVALEINPSMELYINKDHKVIKVIAVSDDATTILQPLTLKGKDLATAVKAITDQAKKEGYLSNEDITTSFASPIVATVVDWKQTQDEAALKGQVEELLQASFSGDEVMVTSTTRQTLEQAHQEKLPVFKYQVVQTIESKGIILEQDTIKSLSSDKLVETYHIDPMKLIDVDQKAKDKKKEKEDKRQEKDAKKIDKEREKQEKEKLKEREKEKKELEKIENKKDKNNNSDKNSSNNKDKNKDNGKNKDKDKNKDHGKADNKVKDIIIPVFKDINHDNKKNEDKNNDKNNDKKDHKGNDKGNGNNSVKEKDNNNKDKGKNNGKDKDKDKQKEENEKEKEKDKDKWKK